MVPKPHGSRGCSKWTPLLEDGEDNDSNTITVQFEKDDPENPRNWTESRKALQVIQILLLALVCPTASSAFAPFIDQICDTFGAPRQIVLLRQSTFMFGLGTGPLFLAPMSETFGRRPLFVTCLALFTLLQISTALAPNVATFIAMRTLTGLVGSVGVANGEALSLTCLRRTSERWFWVMGCSGAISVLIFFLLYESNPNAILQARRKKLQK